MNHNFDLEERYIKTFGEASYKYWLASHYPAQYNYFNKHQNEINSILAEYEVRAKKREEALTIPQEPEYKIEFNPIDKQFWIYTIWGYTTISKRLLDKYFI